MQINKAHSHGVTSRLTSDPNLPRPGMATTCCQYEGLGRHALENFDNATDTLHWTRSRSVIDIDEDFLSSQECRAGVSRVRRDLCNAHKLHVQITRL